MRAWFQCMILHGFFHGDVHAGNLMALDDGRIGFLDFGIVGRFARERREQVTDYLHGVRHGRLSQARRGHGARWARSTRRSTSTQLAKDLAEAYEPMLENEAAAT